MSTATVPVAAASAPRLEAAMLEGLRKAIVLLCVESLDLRTPLLDGIEISLDGRGGTQERVLRAAAELGLAETNGDRVGWSATWFELCADDGRWRRLLALLRHHTSYLRLASELREGNPVPAEQVASDPASYLEFLAGVDASHTTHAQWLACLDVFAGAGHLVDLGGGLGTFSRAWIESASGRTAVLVDLPQVVAAVAPAPGLRVEGADLTALDLLPGAGDVYLLANVLHLLPNWREVLLHVARSAPDGADVAVFEADPTDGPGVLFDLQVHLRSGGVGGLLDPDDVEEALARADLSLRAVVEPGPDEGADEDPFRRTYRLWIARRAAPVTSRASTETRKEY